MIDPIFWLVLSFLLVSISLTAVLVVLVPAVRELSRAARSVEKLCDTINRELPPTLESIRLTSAEITSLTDDVTEGVQNASHIAQQVDQSVTKVGLQAKRLQVGTRSLMAGFNAALDAFIQPESPQKRSKGRGRVAGSRQPSISVRPQPSSLSPRSPQPPKRSPTALPPSTSTPAGAKFETRPLPPTSVETPPRPPASPEANAEDTP